MTELREIRLEDIEDLPNYREIEPPSATDADMIELAADVKSHGILQPVLCRPHSSPSKEKAGKVQLIYGHRRKLAAIMNSMPTVPGLVKIVPDDQVLEIQVTENLQRKDVHPLDEASAFKAYMDQKKIDIMELGHKFGKPATYIAQRLSFNGLITDAKKDFKAGILLIGHAVQLARLQPEDQKTVISKCRNTHHKNGSWYDPVDHMKEVIEDEIMHELTHAAFDKKDAKLVKKAGTCVNCQKRSGAGLLFPDIKEKDRCFDAACYKLKSVAHLLNQINELVLAPNPMPVVMGYSTYGMDPKVKKLLADNKIKLLEENTDYYEAPKKSVGATMALKVCGSNEGRIIGITFRSSSPKAKAAKAASANATEEETAEMIESQIAGIRERAKRNLELDQEKIHRHIVDTISDLKPFKEPDASFPQTLWERAAIYFFAYKKMNSDDQKKVAQLLGLTIPKGHMNFFGGDEKLLMDKLVEAPPGALAFIARASIRYQMMTNSIIPPHTEAYIVRKVAEQYPAVPIAQYEAEQKVIADKRIGREKERIEDLQAKKKALKVKLAPKKKSTSKKTDAGAKESKRLIDMTDDELDQIQRASGSLGQDEQADPDFEYEDFHE